MSDSERAKRREALIERFRNLSKERLERLGQALVELEHSSDPATAEDAQRELHTLKGEAKLLGFNTLSSLAHATEDLLLSAQRYRFRVGAEVFDGALSAFDTMSSLLVPRKEEQAEDRARELTEHLDGLARGPLGSSEKADEVEVQSGEIPARRLETALMDLRKVDQLTELVGRLAQDRAQREQLDQRLVQLSQRWHQHLRQAQVFRAGWPEIPEPLRVALKERLRAQSVLWEDLNELLRDLQDISHEESVHFERIEESFREIRLQPLGTLFGAIPRAARDLARELDKEVRVELFGEEVEVDQRVLEGLREPLLHLLRNSIDHGLETPAERLAGGKPAVGTIRIRAAEEGASAVLTLADDGAGIDIQGVRRAALASGQAGADDADQASVEEALQWIFRPGLSTRPRATEVSGRGVGLDVVKAAVETLGGGVEVSTALGGGTTFRLRVPISVAFQRVVVVEEGSGLYALPATAVERIARPGMADLSPSNPSQSSPSRGNGRMVLADDEGELPVTELAEIFEEPSSGGLPTVLVMRQGGRRFALRVARLLGERPVMRRPLGRFLRGQRLYLGTAFVDGRPVLLLNVAELRALAGSKRKRSL